MTNNIEILGIVRHHDCEWNRDTWVVTFTEDGKKTKEAEFREALRPGMFRLKESLVEVSAFSEESGKELKKAIKLWKRRG